MFSFHFRFRAFKQIFNQYYEALKMKYLKLANDLRMKATFKIEKIGMKEEKFKDKNEEKKKEKENDEERKNIESFNSHNN